MAIGDVTQKKLLQKALSTTATGSAITNVATEKTTITSISLVNTGIAKRTVKVYAYGSAAANEIIRIPLEAGASELLTGLDYVLSSTESMYFAQDVGADVNIAVMGISEVVA